MRSALLFHLVLFCVPGLRAQYTIDWSYPAADIYKTGVMAARDTADALIVVGYRPSFMGDGHIFTQKYDLNGVLLWEQVDSTGNNVRFEQPTWVSISSTNDIYVSGFLYSGTNTTYPDSAVVLKYDPQGTLLWKRKVERSLTFGVRSAVDAQDNLYLGIVGASPSGFSLVKFDPNGNEVFDVSEANPIGASLVSMRVKDDRVVLVGSGGSLSHGAVASWDTSGNFLWSHRPVGFGAQTVELDDALNTYVLTSFTNQVSATSERDAVIKKYNAAGDSITQLNYDFNGTDQPTRMTLVHGRITVIGWNVPPGGGYMNWSTFQIDTSGALLWNATYDAMVSNDEISGWVAAKDNGEVFVTGKGGPLYQGQYVQYVTLKYSNGVQQWVHTDPFYGSEGVACVLGKDSALYVLGRSAMTATRYIDDISTAVEDRPTAVDLAVYPVPADDRLVIRRAWPGASVLAYAILDASGCVILHGSLANGETSFDVSGLANGAYLLRTNDGRTERFVVRH